MNLFVERFMEIVAIIFVSYMLLYTTFLFLTVWFGASRLSDSDRMNRLKNEIKHDYYMPISILVPAYNEEVNIVESVTNLLHLDYKLYEIIIVDDGSTDKTVDMLLDEFSFKKINRPLHRELKCKKEKSVYETTIKGIHITLICKHNGGKSDALNMGINASNCPYFVTKDADSLLQSDSLEKIIQPILEDESIVAVGGMVQVAQSIKLKNGKVHAFRIPWQPLIGMQVVEYDRSFLASRILMDEFNGNLIVSGAFGLFKKDIVKAVGGYKTDTIGEDMELIMRIHAYMLNNRHAYKMYYLPQAVCWSQSPYKLFDIFKQRRRWYIGLFQSLINYPEMLTRFRYKPVGFISYIYYWIFELFAPFIEIFGLSTILLASHFGLLNVPFMINLFIIYTAYGILLSLTVFLQRVYTQKIRLDILNVIKAIIMILLENVFYRYLISFIRITSFINYNKGRKSWGEISRDKLTDTDQTSKRL